MRTHACALRGRRRLTRPAPFLPCPRCLYPILITVPLARVVCSDLVGGAKEKRLKAEVKRLRLIVAGAEAPRLEAADHGDVPQNEKVRGAHGLPGGDSAAASQPPGQPAAYIPVVRTRGVA